MAKEYSVYFDNRKVMLSENIEQHFVNEFGLFVSYNSPHELSKILEFFQSTIVVENVFITGKKNDVMLDDFSCLFRVIDAAGGLVKNQNGEYLLIFRRGKWDLPKGKQEVGELLDKSALREVAEETGISNIELKRHLVDTYHTYKMGEVMILKKTHWFEMHYNGNESLVPQYNEDIVEAKWVSKDQLKVCLENTFNTIREVFQFAGVV